MDLFTQIVSAILGGLNHFLDFAFMRGSVRGKIRCPCEKCKFGKWKTREEVVAHCLDKQFPIYYLNWAFMERINYTTTQVISV